MTNQKNTKRALLSSALALFLCFAMLLGTTYAWFTDSVTSSGNIIQTGELKIGFQWAEGNEDPSTANWNKVNGAIFDYANWEPNYAVAKHLKVTNEGTLALNYQMRIVADGVVSKLADVIDVYYFAEDKALDRADLDEADYLGTLTEVMGTNKNLTKTVKGSIKAGGEADIHTLILVMNKDAGNEYQNMDLGCTFSIQLLATQMADEKDSFDNQYDNDALVPNEGIPAALVRPLDNLTVTYTKTFPNGTPEDPMTLDAGYQFEPTISYEEALDSIYRYWHADFVVKADKDVPADSITLAGYYSAFCDDYNRGHWVALTNEGADIAAGTEVRLVASMADGLSVNWEEICKYGNDGKGFQCGIADVSGTGANAGTTVTVELRIYETTKPWDDTDGGTANTETGNYITVGVFTHTFDGTPIATADALAAAMAQGGNYKLVKDIAIDANTAITVPAGVTTVLNLNGYEISATADKTGNQEAFLVKGDLTVKNGSMELVAKNNQGWGSMATIFDVTAGGKLTMDNVTANVSGTDMNFIVHLNNWGSATLDVNNCDFTTTYVAVRAFNSGYDMNTVTIKNTDFHGGRVFWVHNYTSEGKDDTTLTLDIYGNGNTTDNEKPVRFGFSDSTYYTITGDQITE